MISLSSVSLSLSFNRSKQKQQPQNILKYKMKQICVVNSFCAYQVVFTFHVYQVEQTYDFRVVATSRIGTVNGDQFGSYEVGPTPEPNKTDDTLRAACFEFRCAGLVHDNGGPVSNLDTVVAARFTYSGTTTKCRLR